MARLRAWLRAFPLQRRVAYLTTVAVALAVAVTSVAGYVTLRISLYRALDAELVQTATSLAAVPVAQDIRILGGLTERALRAGTSAWPLSGPTAKPSTFPMSVIIWCWAPRS
jgi:two-component system sensor histidine kinase MprB